jgi:hypothetical protein
MGRKQYPFVQENAFGQDPSVIVVSTSGSDTTGYGSWVSPVKTLTKALSLASTTRATIFMLPGEYAEATMIDWPDISGLSVIGMGSVTISNADASAAVIDIHPTYTAASMGISMKDITISADTQIGLQIDNAHMSKKLNIYLDGVSIEDATTGGGSSDSISMANTVGTQAIRIYAKNCSFELLVHITTANAGGRYRFTNCDFLAGVTTAGAVAAEFTFLNCISNAAITKGSETPYFANKGCILRTDADPAVYSDWVDSAASG